MMENTLRIAVDGPSGAGKSTVARLVAAALCAEYIDTGAMYRAVGLKLLEHGVCLEDGPAVAALLSHTDIDFRQGEIYLDGEIASHKIRTPQASKMASDCSSLPAVREKLVALQRKMGQEKSVVMDGRDIGTNVFTDAEYKFYLTASVEERAKRRYAELKEKGETVSLAQVERDIIQRDHNDSTRKLNPLRKAEDAIEIDSTGMDVQQVAEAMLGVIRKSVPEEK